MRNGSRLDSAPLSAKVTERIRRAIIDAKFELGEALSEDKIATALGVSRTPVREALNALQLQGLIVIKPQVGSFVFSPTEEDVDALCTFRRILELEALRLSFAYRREGTTRQLVEANRDMEVARRANDHLGAVRADAALHEALIENSTNSYLIEAYGLVSGRVGALRAHNLTGARDVRGRSIGEHDAIISAYSIGDLQRAEALLGEHIMKMGDAFRAAKRRGALAERQASRRRSLAEIWPEGA